MAFHWFGRTCHFGMAKAATLTSQQEICDVGREMQQILGGSKVQGRPVALYMCLRGTGCEEREQDKNGSLFKWPSCKNPSYSTCDSIASHCSNQANLHIP